MAAIAAEGGQVVVRTGHAFLSLPAFLAATGTIVLAPASYDPAGAVRAIIGSGPYRLTSLLAPQRLDAERFEGWWGGTPAIERVSYLAVGRGETRAAMAEAGQAELVTTLAPETVERLRRNPRLDVVTVPIPRTRAVKLNARSPFFADVRARRAFALALDREGIARALLRSPGSAANQLFPPALPDWHLEGLPPPRRDLAAAMQAQLREAGIELRIAIMNSGEIPARHRDGTLEAALFARALALVPDLLAAAARLGEEAAPAGRGALAAPIARILHEEQPVVSGDRVMEELAVYLGHTLALGPDSLARQAHARRLSLGLAILTAIGAAVPGVLLGLLAARRGGWADRLLSGLAEGVMALPGLLIVLVLAAFAPGEVLPLHLGLPSLSR